MVKFTDGCCFLFTALCCMVILVLEVFIIGRFQDTFGFEYLNIGPRIVEFGGVLAVDVVPPVASEQLLAKDGSVGTQKGMFSA